LAVPAKVLGRTLIKFSYPHSRSRKAATGQLDIRELTPWPECPISSVLLG
jgi:hypothetical protein